MNLSGTVIDCGSTIAGGMELLLTFFLELKAACTGCGRNAVVIAIVTLEVRKFLLCRSVVACSELHILFSLVLFCLHDGMDEVHVSLEKTFS